MCYPVNKYRPGINKPLTSIGLCKDDELVTIGASFYRDHKDIVYINVHLNTSDTEETNTEIIVKLYEKLFVGCVYEHEDDKPVFFIPQSSEDMETKENSNFYTQMNTKSWYVDTNFMNRQKSTLSFLIYLPGTIGQDIESLGTIRKFPTPPLPLFTPDQHQMQLLIDGFIGIEETLYYKSHSVATVIGFMNLTNHMIDVQTPALSSGVVGTKSPWPTKVKPLTTETFLTRKASYSMKGCVGAYTITLPGDLNIIFYWHTPYDQNIFENSFAIGYYRGELKTVKFLLDKINCLPTKIPEGLNFTKQLAKDGPLTFHIDSIKIYVKMTTNHKACLQIILLDQMK